MTSATRPSLANIGHNAGFKSKRPHIVRLLALFLAGLIVSGAVGGAAFTPFGSRLSGLLANLIPASTASAAGNVRATGERVTLHLALECGASSPLCYS